MLGLIAFLFYAGIAEEEYFVAFLVPILMGPIYYYLEQIMKAERDHFDAERPIETWRGALDEKIGAAPGATYFTLDGRRVEMPAHWVGLLERGRIGAEVARTARGKHAYLLSTSTGLSLQKEEACGVENTFSFHRGRKGAVFLGLVFAFLYLVFLSQEAASGVSGVFELFVGHMRTGPLYDGAVGPVKTGTLGLSLLFGVPGVWFFHKHTRAVQRIRQMYREAGVKSVRPSHERRRTKMRRAAIGAVLGGMAFGVFHLFMGAGAMLFGALFGAVVGGAIGWFERALRG